MKLTKPAPVNTNTLLPTHHVRPSGTPAQSATQPSAGSAPAQAVGLVTKEQDLANRKAQITASLTDMFEFHITDDNREAMHAMIEVRAKRLAEEGEDGKGFDHVMSKGAKLDHMPRITKGMLFAGSFAANSLTQDFVPSLKQLTNSPRADSAIKSGISASSDLVSGAMLKRPTSNLEWLVAEEKDLEPLMQKASQRVKPSLARQAAEGSVAFQVPFVTRNVSRFAIKPLVTLTHGAETAATVDAIIGGVGSLFCGAGAYEIQHAIDKRMHRAGPEYLMGRTDWHERYTELKNYGVTDAATGLARRAGRLPLELARDSLPAARSAITGGGLATMTVLGVGLVGIGEAVTGAAALATKAGRSPATVAAAGSAALVGSMGVVVPAWVATAITGQHVVDAAAAKLDKFLGRSDHIDQMQGSVPVPDAPTEEPESSDDEDEEFFDTQSHFGDPEHMV